MFISLWLNFISNMFRKGQELKYLVCLTHNAALNQKFYELVDRNFTGMDYELNDLNILPLSPSFKCLMSAFERIVAFLLSDT